MGSETFAMPEPVAIDLDREHELFGQWFKDRYGYAPDMDGDSGPARWAAWLGRSELAADQLRAAVLEALSKLEETVGDLEEPAWYGYENPNTFDDGKRAACAVIRQLAEQVKKGVA